MARRRRNNVTILNPARSRAAQRIRSLTAAGARIKSRDADTVRRLIQPWQTRAYAYYDLLGEIKYAAQFYSRSLSQLELYAAEEDENGELVKTENAAAVDMLARVQDPGGGRASLLASYGRLMFLAGECYLLCTQDLENEVEQWEMLSTDEVRVTGANTIIRYKAPSLLAEDIHEPSDDDWEPMGDGEGIVYRIWKRSPRYSMLADSTMQGVLDLCVAEGSMVSTRRGPTPIEEVKVGDEVFSWTADGLAPNRVVRHCVRGEQEVYKVTAGRRTIRATAEHQVLVLRKSKPGKGFAAKYEPEWIEVADLKIGDHLIAAARTPDYGKPQRLPDGTPLTKDVAWLLGHIVGDGHVHGEGVNIAVYNDERRARIASIMRSKWNLEDHPQGGDARFYSRALRRTLTRMGLRVKSHDKTIPAVVLAAPETIKRAFLAGYEEADGHLTKQGWQSLALTSERLARELRSLYIELGENVSNPAVEERAAVMAMPGGHMTENAKPLHRFQVYYGSIRRGASRVLQAKDAHEKIGGEAFTLATVKRVEPDGIVPTYDLEVEGAHNYVADGVVTHNCEELVLLTQAVRARARSRLAGPGILFIADSFSPPPVDMNAPDDDANEDPFLAALTEAAMTPIMDEGSASAVVPLIIRGPQEAIEKGIKHVQIIDPTQLYPETGLRYECIKRLAIGLDMPPEILLGISDTNHWGSWQVDEQVWKAHLQPVAMQLCNDLTSAFFRPSLKAAGVEDWEKYSIAFDAAAVINHPDRTKDAKDLYDRVAIGKEALRDAAGFDEDDAPTEEERAERVGILTHDSSLAWFGEPKITTGGVEEAPGQLVTPGGEVGTPGAATGAEVEKGPPSGAQEQPTAPEETVIGAARIEGALDLAILRAREAAGSKLRSRAQRGAHSDDAVAALLRDTSPGKCASVLGPERLRAVSPAGELELVEGARTLIVDSLRMFGITDEQKANEVCDRVLVVAARTLYEESAARTPASLVHYVAGLGLNGASRNGN